MAVSGITIDTPVEGDDFDIEREVTGVPATQTMTLAWFTAKEVATDLDNAAIVQKAITTTPQAGIGQITDDGADGTGTLVFSLTPADTLAIYAAAVSPLVYDIQIKTSANKIYTLEFGTIQVIQQVTLSSS